VNLASLFATARGMTWSRTAMASWCSAAPHRRSRRQNLSAIRPLIRLLRTRGFPSAAETYHPASRQLLLVASQFLRVSGKIISTFRDTQISLSY
jgi:hypothetical protein